MEGKKKTQMNKLVIKQKPLLGGRDEMNRNLKKVERKAFETREFTFFCTARKKNTRNFYGHFKKRLFEDGNHLLGGSRCDVTKKKLNFHEPNVKNHKKKLLLKGREGARAMKTEKE